MVKVIFAIALILMMVWYFKPDLSLEECEAKYGHLTEIRPEDNYLPRWPEEKACFATIEAERIRLEEEEERLAAEEAERIRLEEESKLAAIAAEEAERIRLEEARLAAIEAERIRQEELAA